MKLIVEWIGKARPELVPILHNNAFLAMLYLYGALRDKDGNGIQVREVE